MNKEFIKSLNKLNKEQKLAVESMEGPLMVVAGPGTGKTQVLALRIANIIKHKKANPSEILALTFSDSAANSMKERLASFIKEQAYDIEIKTFHSFCNDIISENPLEFRHAKELKQLEELDKIKLIQEIIDKESLKILKPFFDRYFYKKDIIQKISELKKEGIRPKQFQSFLDGYTQKIKNEKKDNINKRTGKPTNKWSKKHELCFKIKDLCRIYESYEKIKKKRGLYDFDDMIIWVLEKFKKDNNFLNEYQNKYKFIHSDEYQDTNTAQNRVIEFLSKNKKNPNIFVVGDDDQSIYRFQGANLANVLYFERKFKNLKIIPININYRSRKEIVELAKKFIEKNKERLINKTDQKINKQITSSEKLKKGLIELYDFKNEDSEHFFITKKIKKLETKGVKKSEIAILLRTNKEVEQIQNILNYANIANKSNINESILEKNNIKNLISIINSILKPSSNFYVYRSLSLRIWGIDPRDFFLIIKNHNKSIIKYIDQATHKEKNKTGEEFSNPKKIKEYKNIILKLHMQSASMPAINFLEYLFQKIDIVKKLIKSKDLRTLNQISSLYSYIKKENYKDPDRKIKSFIKDFEIMKKEGVKIKEKKLQLERDSVNILTAHQSKGEEYEIVFIPHLYRGSWDGKRVSQKIKLPRELINTHNNSGTEEEKEDKIKIEEERRLFFVSLSRAKKQIYLSRAESYEVNGRQKVKSPSKFLTELESDLIGYGDSRLFEKETIEKKKLELGFDIKRKTTLLSDTIIKDKDLEKDFLKKRVKKITLSPTSLNLYLNCPKRFKMEKLLLVPSLKNKAAILGTAIHKALENFYLDIMRDRTVRSQKLINYFKEALKEEVIDKKDYDDVLYEGVETLAAYYDYYNGSWLKPIALETEFNKIKFGDAFLTGKIDKIEEIERGDHKSVRVIDYKTKAPVSRNQIKGLTQNSNGDIFRQLIFYKLLSTLDNNFPYKIEETQIDFVKGKDNSFKKETFKVQNQEVNELKKIITKVTKKIKELDFKKTDNHLNCKFCDYYDICD